MRRRNPRVHAAAGVWLVAALLIASATAAAERVVAVGDVHGDFDALVSILRAAGLIDSSNSWSGGETHLVQLGDILDRGPRPRAALDLLMRLQQEAPAHGGKVEVLLGNHEALNLARELRDVSPESLQEFADADSEQRLSKEYKSVIAAARARSHLLGTSMPTVDRRLRQAWLDAHPPGFVAFLQGLEPDGEYGSWLRQRPTALRVGDTLFMHAGVNVFFSEQSPDEINAGVHDEISRLDRCRSYFVDHGLLAFSSNSQELIRVGYQRLETLEGANRQLDGDERRELDVLEQCKDFENWLIFRADGPLWFRGYAGREEDAGWSDEDGEPRIARVLSNQNVKHVVVAHSVQSDGQIRQRFDGRIFLIDTGMLADVYRGRPSALEIRDGIFTAIYTDGRERLWPAEEATTAQQPFDGVAEPALEAGLGVPGPLPLGLIAPPTLSLALQGAAEEAPAPDSTFRWIGREGEPLPFSSEQELLDFLSNATIVDAEVTKHGINRPRRVTLEMDGVRMRAAFRDVRIEYRNHRGPQRRFYRLFKDDYVFEKAAYDLAKLLGYDFVPPTVLRRYRSDDGSLQAWVEKAMIEKERVVGKHRPPDVVRWSRQKLEEQLFDALINNQDRNAGNSLIDEQWNLWLIDHTRAFMIDYSDELPKKIQRAPRKFYERLRDLEPATIEQHLGKYLTSFELNALLGRREKILERIEAQIAQNGEGVALLD